MKNARRSVPACLLALLLLLLSAGPLHGQRRAPPDREERVAARRQPGPVAPGRPLVDDPSAVERAAALSPLRELADRAGLLLGTAMDPASLRRSPEWVELATRNFSSVTAANAMKWEKVHPEPGEGGWSFQESDAVVVFAEQHDMQVRGHALLMRRTPDWVSALKGRELQAAVDEHIATLVGRYRGRVRVWDVVNEAVDDDGEGLFDSVFHRELGPGFVADAFRAAHRADPDALLFYNDYDLERPGPKADAAFALLRELLADGVPIHGLGLQCHLDASDPPDPQALAEMLRRFSSLGLLLEITELDVRVAQLPGDWSARFERQAAVFADVVTAAGRGSGVSAITFWGLTDELSWIHDGGGVEAPLLFDEAWTPKPAWFAVHDALAALAGGAPPADDGGEGPSVRAPARRPVRPERGW